MSDSDEEVVLSTKRTKCFKLLDSDEDTSETEGVTDRINDVESPNSVVGSKPQNIDFGENDAISTVISEQSIPSDDEYTAFEKVKKSKPFDSDEDCPHGKEISGDIENDDWTLKVPADGEGHTANVNTSSTSIDDQVDEQSQKKPKRYQLLSDDDLSDENSDLINSVQKRKTSNNENRHGEESLNTDGDSSGTSNLNNTEKRKKKLQKLNDLKRKEIENNRRRSSSSSASDSEGESSHTSLGKPPFKSGPQKKDKRKENELNHDSDKSSVSSGSENENKSFLCSNASSSKSSKKPKASRKKSKQADPMLEIRSKTQKMIREGRIALPYHQPKQRSLDEFLQRRRNVPSIPLKPSFASLSLVSEHLSKREQEVAEFYKSDSDHENLPNEDQVEESGSHGTENEKTTVVDSLANSAEADPCNSENHAVTVTDANSSDDSDMKLATSAQSEAASTVEDSEIKVATCHDTGTENASISMDADSGHTETESMIVDQELEEGISNIVASDSGNSDASEQGPNLTVKEINAEPCVIPEQICNNREYDVPMTSDSCLDSDINLQIENSDPVQSVSENTEVVPNGNESEIRFEGETNRTADSNEFLEKNAEVAESNSVDIPVDSSSNDKIESTGANAPRAPEATADVDKLNVCPTDSEDFQLVVQDSCSGCEDSQFSEKVCDTGEPSNDIRKSESSTKSADAVRSRKLALLSKYNVDLSSDVKLNSESNSFLQFEVGVANPGVYALMQKFARHVSAPSKPPKKSTKLSVISAQTDSQGEVNVVKEVLTLQPTDDVEDEYAKNEFALPGSKYAHFKIAMLKKLVSKKEADWNKYQTEKYRYTSDNFDDEEIETDDTTGRKLHFEPYHPEDEPDDEDLIEDDVELTDGEKRRNEFLDEEADVSFDEEENIDNDAEEDEELNDENCDDADEDEDRDEENEGEEENEQSEGDVDNDIDSCPSTQDISNSPKKDEFQEPKAKCNEKLFKHEITGSALENKLLGLESFSSQNAEQTQDITNSQVFSLCSGKFVTQPMHSNFADLGGSQFITDSQLCDDSQNFNLSMQDTNHDFLSAEGITAPNFSRSEFLLSDESDTEELFARKKKTMRIEDSDDESEKPDQRSDALDDGEENSNDPVDEANEDDVDDLDDEDDVDGVGYNSEEEIVNYKETVAKEFFENEAELSESEWGSEDENEKDLDVLEQEAGDAEDIDADKLKEELGKIHMRQLLDDDQREVRLLQEMLLEDGELHSNTNRQRKFQWKNLDGDDFLKGFNDSDDENALNEDNDAELEENWRKIRHEREAFLSQQEKRSDNLLLDLEHDENGIIQVASTTKVIVESASLVSEPVPDLSKSPNMKIPFNTKRKCGSFLSRGKMLLNRIAVTVGESKENIQGRAKNSRNFVFGAKSPERELTGSPVEKTEKRKISSKSVMAAKKLKLSNSGDSGMISKPAGLLAQLELSE